jgi:hypothetical protein
MNKGENLKQLTFHCLKFIEDGFTWDGVENIHYIHFKHHPIRVDIKSGLNTMDYFS